MVRRLLLAGLVLVVVLFVGLTATAYWLFAGDGVRLAIERQASAWLGQPVRIAAARTRIFPRAAIELGDVRIGEPVRLQLAEVQLSTDLRALLSKTIDDATITIADSRIELPLPFAPPARSEPAAPDSSSAPSAGAIRLGTIRAIVLDDILIVSRGREIRVSADSSLAGGRLRVRRFEARSGKTTLDAQGEVDLATGIDARLTMTANSLDLDELLALADAFAPRDAARGTTRSAGPLRIVAQVSADTASAGGLDVRGFAARLAVEGDRVSLDPLTLQLFGGTYEGSLNARLDTTLALTIRSQIENVDVAALAAFGGSPDTISGTLGGSGTFSGAGVDLADVWNSARGEGTASIVGGEIRRLNLVRTVVLFFGRPAPDAGEGSDRFERIDARFTLANRVFRADEFSLQSHDADIVGSGTLDAATKALDGRLDVVLSEALSKQAGTDLIRVAREGNRVVVPARLGGTIVAPRLTIDAAAAAGRGLRNELQRRLEGLLEGIGNR